MHVPTKGIGVLVIALFLAGVARSAEVDSHDSAGATKDYLQHTFSAQAAASAAAGAAVNQAVDTPHEWGQGALGFGRRFASGFGKHIVHKTIQYPVAHLLHEEIHYHRSTKNGFGPRLKYALVGTVITRKTNTEKRTVAVGEISGALGSGLISRLWQPASTRSLASGFASGGITLGVDAGLNVVREFWPEIRHPRQRASPAATYRRTTPDRVEPAEEPLPDGNSTCSDVGQ
jgi:hypothetical protein